MVNVIRFYKTPGLSAGATSGKTAIINQIAEPITVKTLTTEACFYVETQDRLTDNEILQLRWILANVLDPNSLTDVSRLPSNPNERTLFIEIGPR
jgi:hypothetical protein